MATIEVGTGGEDLDFIIIGSGFGGSVSALRLVEKGYRVLMLEKGGRLGPKQFPKSNWDLRRWMWMPQLGWRGLFKMTMLPHLTALSGVGYGGGSLVYANTLPVPPDAFFNAPSWGGLAGWKDELAPHYKTAQRMLGAVANPNLTVVDEVMQQVGQDIGRPEGFQRTNVAVYFGESGKTVPDPYFGGKGPERTGCNFCGGCMLGCRFGAKNTLDKNYLHLAEQDGLVVETDTTVQMVRKRDGGGYRVEAVQSGQKKAYTARNVVFSGGVLGTVDLMLRCQEDAEGLPLLSQRLGHSVRTNSEALIGVTSERRDQDFSRGIAIGSILHTDEHSHIEPVRYSAGSGFWRMLAAPHVAGATTPQRLANALGVAARHPLKLLKAMAVPDYAKYTIILLYMRTLEGSIRLKLGRGVGTGFARGLTSELGEGPAPTAFMPEATELAHRVASKINGYPQSILTETLMGIPTTAHILGGACMGGGADDGVIDSRHRVFGYDGLYVIDGASVSANPGVNPSLTITALAERAMGAIPARAP